MIDVNLMFGKELIENLPSAISTYGKRVLLIYGGGSVIDCFRQYIIAGGNKEGDYVIAYGADKPGDVVGTPAMEQAYALGKSVS